MGHTPCSVMVGSEPAGVLHAGGVRQFTMTPSTGQRPVWAMLVQRSVFRSLSYVVVVCVRRCCERRATVGDLRTVRYIRTYDSQSMKRDTHYLYYYTVRQRKPGVHRTFFFFKSLSHCLGSPFGVSPTILLLFCADDCNGCFCLFCVCILFCCMRCSRRCKMLSTRASF